MVGFWITVLMVVLCTTALNGFFLISFRRMEPLDLDLDNSAYASLINRLAQSAEGELYSKCSLKQCSKRTSSSGKLQEAEGAEEERRVSFLAR